METKRLLDLLQQHPFVQGLEPTQLERLAGMAAEARFAKGQTIFREGDESSFFYLILGGRVELEVLAPGRVFHIQTIGPGEGLGWSSLLSPIKKQFQARSLEPVHALAFDGARLLAACDEDPAFGFQLLCRVADLVAARLQATRRRLLEAYAQAGVKL